MKYSPFDHRQDRELGDALRSVLSGRDEAAFVRRVLDSASKSGGQIYGGAEWWEVLSAWARPGLAAAVIGVAAAAIMWFAGVRNSQIADTPPPDLVQASAGIPETFLTTQPPLLDEVLAMEFGN